MAGQRVQNFIASLMRNFIASSRGEVYIYIYEFHTESMRSVSNVFVCVCHADWNFTALNHKRDVKSYLHCT